jgi:signal peptidase I
MRPQQDKQETKKSSAIQLILQLLNENLPLAVIALFAFGFIFQNFMIPSGSMASTLLVGDHVVVDRAALAPPTPWASFLPYREVQRGDIVVFYKPVEEKDGEHIPLVKRVIGLPGDRVHLVNGVVYLNGQPQTELHPSKPPYNTFNPYRDNFPAIAPNDDPNITAQWSVELPTLIQNGDLVVPAGKYFVMGDNRAISLDSRYWGLVPRENIIGRPLFVYWSFPTPDNIQDTPGAEQAGFALHQALHFFDESRWRRTFHITN